MITTLVQALLLVMMVLLCFYFLTNRRKARARAEGKDRLCHADYICGLGGAASA